MDKNAAQPEQNQPAPTHEKREINARAITIAVLALIIVAVVVHVLMWLEFSMLDTASRVQDPKVSPLLPARQVPPGPHLDAKSPTFGASGTEPFTTSNLRTLRSEEKNMLDSYAWVDERNGVVRIPIEEAMKMVVEKEKQKQSGTGSQTQTAAD